MHTFNYGNQVVVGDCDPTKMTSSEVSASRMFTFQTVEGVVEMPSREYHGARNKPVVRRLWIEVLMPFYGLPKMVRRATLLRQIESWEESGKRVFLSVGDPETGPKTRRATDAECKAVNELYQRALSSG